MEGAWLLCFVPYVWLCTGSDLEVVAGGGLRYALYGGDLACGDALAVHQHELRIRGCAAIIASFIRPITIMIG